MENVVQFRKREEPEKENEEMVATTNETKHEFDKAFLERLRNGTSTPNDQFELQISRDEYERPDRESDLKLKRLIKPAYVDVLTEIENIKKGSNDKDRLRFLEDVKLGMDTFLPDDFNPNDDDIIAKVHRVTNMKDRESLSIILYYLEKGFPDFYVTLDPRYKHVIHHSDNDQVSINLILYLLENFHERVSNLGLEDSRRSLRRTFKALLLPEDE